MICSFHIDVYCYSSIHSRKLLGRSQKSRQLLKSSRFCQQPKKKTHKLGLSDFSQEQPKLSVPELTKAFWDTLRMRKRHKCAAFFLGGVVHERQESPPKKKRTLYPWRCKPNRISESECHTCKNFHVRQKAWLSVLIACLPNRLLRKRHFQTFQEVYHEKWPFVIIDKRWCLVEL